MTAILFILAWAYGFCVGFIYVCSSDPFENTWGEFFKRRLWFLIGAPILLAWLYARHLWERR